MAESGQGSRRDAVRWGLLLAAVAVSGYRLPGTLRNFQQWRAALPVEPSAADLYKTNFAVNGIGMAIILGVAIAVFYLLRPRAAKRP
ncbi:MAG TPA: hypothetical protein VKQ28_07485 [Candidatus Acidoferrum sp.]|nr:hypothetical protein [Candidatus Acidoferrum sp.]